MSNQYRHGDVFLQRIDALPKGAKTQKREGDIILALGEVTGHAHRLKTAGVVLWSVGDQRYVMVPEGGAALTHEEHNRIDLPAGIYQVSIQREYAPDAIRNVRD